MKKLTIKELAPYLPYNLKGILIEDKVSIFHDEVWFEDESIFQPNAVWQLCGFAECDLNIPLGEGYFDGFLWRNGSTYVNFHRGIKLILRPLSAFGDSDDLRKVHEFIGHGNWCENYNDYFKAWFDDLANIDNLILKSPYEVFQFFLANHYDVFGLIDQNLAVDINTLNQ